MGVGARHLDHSAQPMRMGCMLRECAIGPLPYMYSSITKLVRDIL